MEQWRHHTGLHAGTMVEASFVQVLPRSIETRGGWPWRHSRQRRRGGTPGGSSPGGQPVRSLRVSRCSMLTTTPLELSSLEDMKTFTACIWYSRGTGIIRQTSQTPPGFIQSTQPARKGGGPEKPPVPGPWPHGALTSGHVRCLRPVGVARRKVRPGASDP